MHVTFGRTVHVFPSDIDEDGNLASRIHINENMRILCLEYALYVKTFPRGIPDWMEEIIFDAEFDYPKGFAWPKSLRRLVFNMCVRRDLPPFPHTLTHLSIKSYPRAELPPLPVGLTHLRLHCCMKLTKLPPIPSTLVELICTMCDITTLPPLPAGLRMVDLDARDVPDSEIVNALALTMEDRDFNNLVVVGRPHINAIAKRVHTAYRVNYTMRLMQKNKILPKGIDESVDQKIVGFI